LIGFFVLHDLDEKFILSEMKCSRRKSKRRSETKASQQCGAFFVYTIIIMI
jgi:hypothetical protein